MQNIDPLYFLTPIVVIGFSVGLVLFWRLKRTLSKWALLYSFIAYFGAIVLKYIVQIPTIGAVTATFGNNPMVLGLYYGIQTGVFEVGGAFLVARIALSRRNLNEMDAEGFGLGLAFWENGILIGLLTFIDYVSYYAILSNPSSSVAQTLYPALAKNSPGLFYGSSKALPLIGYAILERVSSLLAHFSWGLLAVLGAVYKKRIYFAVAFPIGFLIDFLTPFSSRLTIGVFELTIFIVAVAGLIASLAITRNVRRRKMTDETTALPEDRLKSKSAIHSLSYTNFRRALNYGKVYVIVGIVLASFISALLDIESIFALHRNVSGSANALGVLSEIPALLLPIFAVMGSFGGLMIFVSDKDKGVYEYLIAYGVNPSRIFWSIVVACMGLVSIVLVISTSVNLGIAAFSGAFSPTFAELLVFYVIPISYSAAVFMSMAGMIWSSLAVRRTGINSPVGVISIIGMLPLLAVLYISLAIGQRYFILFTSGVSIALIIAVVVMIRISSSRMVRERFLSNA